MTGPALSVDAFLREQQAPGRAVDLSPDAFLREQGRDPLSAIEARLDEPRATVTAGPITPVGVSAAEIARVSAPAPRTRGDAADTAASLLRGLAESGYGTAQGVANLADRLPFVDRAGEVVRKSRGEMRDFYGDPESTAGKAALIGGNLVGSGAQFMVPGAALTRAAQVLGAGSKTAAVLSTLANPLGAGGAARTAAGRMIGGTVLNTPLNLAISQSPEDNTAGFVGALTDSDQLKAASKNPLAAFAVETAADLTGNALLEGVAAGGKALLHGTKGEAGFIKAPARERVPRAVAHDPLVAVETKLGIATEAPKPDAPAAEVSAAEVPKSEAPEPTFTADVPADLSPEAFVKETTAPKIAEQPGPLTEAEIERSAIDAEDRESVLDTERTLPTRDEKGTLRRNLKLVTSDAIESEIAHLQELEAADEALVAHRQTPEYVMWQNLPDAEKLSRSERTVDLHGNKITRQREDLPDAGGEIDSEQLNNWRKNDVEYNRGTMSRTARRKSMTRLQAELESRGLVESSDQGTPFGAPAKRITKDTPSLFGGEDLFGGARTMGDTDVGMAQRPPKATGTVPELPGSIGADEMAARRDELGFEKSAPERTATPDQGAFFSPDDMKSTPPPLPPPSAAAPPVRAKGMTPQREMASEILSAALGGVAGAAWGGEDNRSMGALIGMVGGYGAARGALAGIKGATQRMAVRDGIQTLRSINLEMARAAGVSVRQGRSQILRRSAAGWFHPTTEAIRLRRSDALDTGAHELGHFISKRLFGNPANKKSFGALAGPPIPLSFAEKKELVAAGRRLYGKSKPTAGYGEEGLAEFVSFYVTEPARAKVEFPLTYAKLVQAMDAPVVEGGPTLLTVVDQARDQYAKWVASPAYQRVSAMISVDEAATVNPTLADFRRIVEDDLFASKRIEREMKALGAQTRGDEISPYEMMLLTRGSAGEAARSLEDGIVINGRKVAEGIEKTLQAVRGQAQDFRTYLVAKRVLEDLLPRGVNEGMGRAEAAEIVARFDAEFQPRAEVIWKFQQAKMRLLESVGLLTKAQADQIIKANPHHVPFQHVFDAGEKAGGTGGRAKPKNSSGVMRIKGSSRQIVDPLETIVKDTYDLMRRVREHDAARRMIQMGLRTEGGSRWFEIVEAPAVPQSFRLTRETIDQLVDIGVLSADQADEISGPMMTGQLAGFLSGFTDAQRAGMREGADLVFPMLNAEGQRQWVQVKDPQVYETFLGMNAEEIGALERFVRKWPAWARAPLIPAKATARTLRAGATLTAEFIARNPVRDAWGAAIRTRAGRFVVPGEHLVRGVYGLLKKDLDYDAWLRTGGANATLVSGDRSVYQKSLRDLQATALERGWYLVRHPVDFMRAVSEIAENATRLGEFKLVKPRALKEGMAPRQADLTAAAASRDITVDFAKAGQAVREANKIVAFLNAYVQGNVNIARDMVRRPQVVLPRIVASITIPSLALEALFHDNETYQEAPDWVKRTAWVIPMGSGPDAAYIAIPKPFELGVLFATIPQRILNGLLTQDPRQAELVSRDLVKAFAPPIVPTLFVPLIENFANRSTFTDRPIVPRDREGEEPGRQAAPRTGETARLVGEGINTSPAQLENVLRGYTGGLGMTALQVADATIRIARERAGADPLKPARDRDKTGVYGVPGLRAFVKPAPGMDAESIQRFYEESDSAEQARQTYAGLLADGRSDAAQRYLKEHLAEVVAMGSTADVGTGPMREQRAQITELRGILKDINRSPQSPAEKRRAQWAVEQAMIAVARGGIASNQQVRRSLARPPLTASAAR